MLSSSVHYARANFLFSCACFTFTCVNIPPICLFHFHVCEHPSYMLVSLSRVWTSLLYACFTFTCVNIHSICLFHFHVCEHPSYMPVSLSRVWTSLLYACFTFTCVNIPPIYLFVFVHKCEPGFNHFALNCLTNCINSFSFNLETFALHINTNKKFTYSTSELTLECVYDNGLVSVRIQPERREWFSYTFVCRNPELFREFRTIMLKTAQDSTWSNRERHCKSK